MACYPERTFPARVPLGLFSFRDECLNASSAWKLARIMDWLGGWIEQDSSVLSNVIAEMISI